MNEIKLYHGTIANIQTVDLNHTKSSKDFGEGFYVTSDLPQATQFAKRLRSFARQNRVTSHVKAFVYYFNVPMVELKALNSQVFSTYNKNWVEYVVMNRTNMHVKDGFDVVVGPVADARTRDEIESYIIRHPDGGNDFNKQELIESLQPWNYVDQYCFKTQRAVNLLNKYMAGRKEL